MRFFIIDNRHFLPSDCRLITVLRVVNETAILGRATSWTHLGIAIVGENMYTDVLCLQAMEHISLFAFNKAFDDIDRIVRNNNAGLGVNFVEKKKTVMSNICFALQSAMKQFKEVKGKKQKELLITIIVARWRGNVGHEVGEFFHACKDAVSNQIHIIEIGGEEPLKNFAFSDKIQIHSLPTKCLYMGVQAVCKTGMRPLELTLNFPRSNINIMAKVEYLFIDFSFSGRDIPRNLSIVSCAYPMDLVQIRVVGRCLLLSCTNTDTRNTYRWNALSKIIQNNGTPLLAREHNTFLHYILIPCDNLRILMQPVICSDLLLPTTDIFTPEFISDEFEAVARHCGLAERYGFGPKSNVIIHLKGRWEKEKANYPKEVPNLKKEKTTIPLKKRISMSDTQLSMASLAHPALGMYSNK